MCHVQWFKPDKTLLISILYIKNTNKAVSIVYSRVLISILYIKNTNKAVFLLNFWSCLKPFNKLAGRVLLGLKPLALRACGFKPNKTLLLVY
jgi:hypothetical protein